MVAMRDFIATTTFGVDPGIIVTILIIKKV